MADTELTTLKKQITPDQLYQGETDELLSLLETDPEKGLTIAEAERRLGEYGPNKLKEAEKEPLWKRFFAQFKDYMTLILLVAAAISGFLGDWVEAAVILAIVIVNAILAVYQEGQADKAVESLQKMSAPHARVLRDGDQQMVASDELVPGDIVLLEAGDVVPADLRLIKSSNLKADEASLTGESVPVEKDARFRSNEAVGIGDRENSLYSSTNVTYGNGRAVVGATGLDTEIGRIAGRIESIQADETPLQQNLNQLGKVLGTLVLVICVIVFGVGVIRGGNIMNTFMTAVALAVAAIPEGLNVVVTIVLAQGMRRMANENAIVKRLLAVETLGSVDVICSDKTGTLTQNEMTVTRIYTGDHVYIVEGVGYAPEGDILYRGSPLKTDDPLLERTLTIATLCNDAVLKQRSGETWQMLGDPTEGAMLTAAGKLGMTQENLKAAYPKTDELPFDSERKMMSVFHEGFSDAPVLSLTKGAPDLIIARCDNELTRDGVKPLTDTRRKEILDQNNAFAADALRVLAMAYREHETTDTAEAEQHMTYVGLLGMIDPARPEVKDSIRLCKRAGIRTVMITGDHVVTAMAIADDLGMVRPGDGALTGAEVDALSDEELREVAEHTAVYARVSPENKVRIVSALRDNGHIVSMTGDGVNDAPALKQADIGVAMGITGTEVAKSTADMILTDDNFATIVNAVEEGRVIFTNIRKFVSFLLSCNVGEILVIFITTLIMGPNFSPLTAIQLLWLNLVTDSFPALALGNEKAEADIMDHPPRKKGEHIITRDMIIQIGVQSVAIFVSVFIAFNIGRARYPDYLANADSRVVDFQGNVLENDSEWDEKAVRVYDGKEELVQGVIRDQFSFIPYQNRELGHTSMPSHGAQTFAFATLILAELLRAYSVRTDRYSVFQVGFFSNRSMVYATMLSTLLLLFVIYVPFMATIFDVIPLTGSDWLVVIILMIIPFITGEVYKLIRFRKERALAREAAQRAREEMND